MAIGWLSDVAQASTYFSTMRLDSSAWDALAAPVGGKNEKSAVLYMAYDRLRFHQDFEIPTTPSAAQLEKLQRAQLETAYYLALHLSDEDRRKGLHAQGVVGANIMGETYVRFATDTMKLTDVPLPPIVLQLMAEFSIEENAKPLYARDIGRDENQTVNADVDEL